MPTRRHPDEERTNIHVEAIERALVFGVDKVKEEMGMNRSDAVAYLLWQGLQHRGETKAGVRAAYAESLAAQGRP
jgi:hypothetical protein